MKTPYQSTSWTRKSSKRYWNRSTEKTRVTKLPYYIADTGHFGIKIKVCFSDAAFQQAVKDSKITTRHNALDVGLAESHFIEQEGTTNAMLAIVFNYEEMAKETALERMGVIYHEVSHTVTHVFEYIGEEDTKIGDESRSYLGEHILNRYLASMLLRRINVNVLEKEIEKHLNNSVKKSGGLSYKWISSVTGVPDRIVFINQKVYLVELKTATGKLSPRQELVFDDLGEQGFPVHIIRSREDVEDFVTQAMRSM